LEQDKIPFKNSSTSNAVDKNKLEEIHKFNAKQIYDFYNEIHKNISTGLS